MRVPRWIGAVGAVIYAVGFVLVSSIPGGGDVDASDFEEFYVTDDNTTLPIIGLFALTIGVLLVLWFFHELRDAIGGSDAGFGWAAGALGLAVVVSGACLLDRAHRGCRRSATRSSSARRSRMRSRRAASRRCSCRARCCSVSPSPSSRPPVAGRALFPGWVAVVGYVAAALQLGAIIWIPSFAVPIWIIIASLTATGAAARGSDTSARVA